MKDPIQLIKSCCDIANRCFVWTHYYNAETGNNTGERTPRLVTEDGVEATYYELGADGQDHAGAWMAQEEIFSCFRHFGLTDIRVFEDAPLHPNGAAMSFTASRRFAEDFVRVTAPP
jgi:hypothetical protein